MRRNFQFKNWKAMKALTVIIINHNLIQITSYLNLIHEIYSSKAIGMESVQAIATKLIENGYSFLEKRLDLVKSILCAY